MAVCYECGVYIVTRTTYRAAAVCDKLSDIEFLQDHWDFSVISPEDEIKGYPSAQTRTTGLPIYRCYADTAPHVLQYRSIQQALSNRRGTLPPQLALLPIEPRATGRRPRH
jgi:hypothetical protein